MQTYLRNAAIGLSVLLVPLLLAGCPSPTPTNQAPVANAGANQSVNPGDAVTLNGVGSSDPDGDTLSFAWVQTAGTNVTLTDADKSTATFTAPVGTEVLTFQLTVSDGDLTATDTVDVGVNAPVTTTPVLYIANSIGSSITAYNIANPNNINGNVAPTANLSGGQTLLSVPYDVVIAADNSLLTVNIGSKSITTYLNARDLSGINGNVAPARNVQGAATTLATPASLAIRTSSDLLFVSDLTPARILVYAGVSTSGFNGNMAPIRTITSTDVTSPIGINFGAGDTLYVANTGAATSIAVFDNASTLNGAVAATRVITSASFTTLYDVYVDVANDRLFALDFGGKKVHVFNNASTRSGPVMPDVTLTVSGASGLMTAVAVDSKGVGYIVDYTANAVYSYDNIATRNGTIAPDRTLKGSNTQLSGAIRLFLLE